jgi:hypothetical protein
MTSGTGSSTCRLVRRCSQTCDISDKGSRHSSSIIATVRYAECITTGKGLATMTATMVGVDWGMAALGITTPPRKARVPAVRAEGLTDRYGEHAAISMLSIDRQRVAARLLEPFGHTTSSAVAMLVRQRREPLVATDLQPLAAVDTDRPEVIHSVHGTNSSGDWFLLADIGASEPSSNLSSEVRGRPCDDAVDAWLVVAGGCVRDMISAEVLEPTPA